MTTRRSFLRTSLLGGAAAALGCATGKPAAAAGPKPEDHDDDLASVKAAQGTKAEKAGKPLRVLLLGGTNFLGPHLVELSRARGHTVTLFNRGKTHPELFPDLEKLRGDRDGKLDALRGREWDAVIDTSGYVPRIVRQSADLLAPKVKRYVFISSISVYPDDVRPGADETTAPQPLTEPGSEEVRKHYGALKALCEQAAETAMPGRALNVRPGLIVGPGDTTDRYTYWPARMDRGGEAVAPNRGEDPVQYIDVRDLSAFIIGAIESGAAGVFNATGPEQRLTVAGLLDACAKASPAPARPVWIPESFLNEQKVTPWQDLPVWTGAEGLGIAQLDTRKAVRAGLRSRPAEETARDTLAWWKTLPEARRAKPRAGLTPEREREVLAAWRAKG